MIDLTKTKNQWLTIKNSGKLHYIEGITVWNNEFFDTYDTQFDGARPWTSSCGINGLWSPPGIFIRLGAARCKKCCDAIGLSKGVGCPVNDKDCTSV